MLDQDTNVAMTTHPTQTQIGLTALGAERHQETLHHMKREKRESKEYSATKPFGDMISLSSLPPSLCFLPFTHASFYSFLHHYYLI